MPSAFAKKGHMDDTPPQTLDTQTSDTPIQPPDNKIPEANIEAPGGLRAVETTNTRVKVEWDPVDPDKLPEDCQLLGYRLEQRMVGGPMQWSSAQGRTKVLEAARFTVVDLTPYESYQIRVRSVLQMNEEPVLSKRSVSIHVVTREKYQPYPPRSVRMVRDTNWSRFLTWEEPSPAADVNPKSCEYVVEMCLHVKDKTRHDWTECGRTMDFKFQIEHHKKLTVNVKCSGDYRFRVSAINKEMNSKVSSLPQEMEDSGIRIRIKKSKRMKQLIRVPAEAFKALWRFSGTYKIRENGSIIFVISCHDVNSLRELWMNYNQGKVKKFFQVEFPGRTQPYSVATDTELCVEIDEQDYYACRRHLLLTRSTDEGFRVVRLGGDQSRGTQLGLSEDYPVYCKPTSHRTTCPQLDFLDPAVYNIRHPHKYRIASMNFMGDTGGVGNAALRKLLLGQLQRQLKPSIVLVQLCPWKDPTLQLLLQKKFCYTGVRNKTGIIWDSEVFEVKCLDSHDLIPADKYPTLYKHCEGACICEIMLKDNPTKQHSPHVTGFLAISWHGPYKCPQVEKQQTFRELLSFSKAFTENSSQKACIIGGGFNFSMFNVDEDIDSFPGLAISASYGSDTTDYLIFTSDFINILHAEQLSLDYDAESVYTPQDRDEARALKAPDTPPSQVIRHKPVIAVLDLESPHPFSSPARVKPGASSQT